MRLLLLFALQCTCAVVWADSATSADVNETQIEGQTVYTLTSGETIAKICPAAGANVFSIRHADVEYLRQPESMDRLPGVGFGNPVLYPTPNRVRNSQFTFGGKRVSFEPNAGPNFIHGLVNRYAWVVVDQSATGRSASLKMKADFGEMTQLGNLYPFPHVLFLTVEVSDARVRWSYEVDNARGSEPVPFGFALHPYFVYQGKRAATFLTIPASHWMESERQLPSGRLVPADQQNTPLHQPFSMQGTKLDDVFWGLTPDRTTDIEFRDVNRSVRIHASDAFTHLVVWTPNQPYFGVESQTCSTDAHNLYSQGFEQASHLQICPPGERMQGWVEYEFVSDTSVDNSRR